MALLSCIGTPSGPCPKGAKWPRTHSLGAPRKRCLACAAREHMERSHLDRLVVDDGLSESAAEVALLMHLARQAIRDRQPRDAMRLTRRAMTRLAAWGSEVAA